MIIIMMTKSKSERNFNCQPRVSFKSVGVFLLTFHYTVYAIDGRGAESLKLNGRVCEACAEIIM